ncbi:AraC family transcriptional regulator [Anoxybacillus ayderensis]|uniref:AraC family transcriptional regulator n=1 Tax=Anoxybacillus ayderensis TaxID=265546 RepID=UPI002E20B4A7|nr:AraC family transcriptional regulator [Anoxybacillus ayderensis]
MLSLSTITGMEIHQHSYWNPIIQFQLSEDTYPHWNLFCIEEGVFEYEVMGQKGEAQFGEIIFCPPHIPLKRKAVTPLKFHFLRFSFRDIEQYELPVGKIKILDTERLSSTYSHLRSMAFNETELSNRWKAHLIYDLLQLYGMENQLLTIDNQPKIKDPVIAKAIEHLHEQAFTHTTIQRIASHCGLSSIQFTRRFQESIGISPSEYLTLLRLRQARTLLLETDYTIDDIANRCGYSNGFYFSRVFSKKMKMSPSSFRKMHRI